ncbi:class I SAM-dependent DNA methyltransferase [Rudanella paleaurantiibacter]|uniref:site-specific DNA-methyltransferase (adenine-specific) n=1 Tax=Rudanella paleaurantiibacter TaxID=2614655 RepID=A0A7J5TYL1_9BACT|nr:TaqI-like C-terminal specificity domain-containing protein [Rudanella paleaurantiibacter]KAB7730213.1 class I SAM-dependent DNA methyltransferase [Rudanella paleaurantiibacter]
MDKKIAQELIEKTFNNAFSEEQFTVFAKNLLNDFEDKHNQYSGNLIWDDYKEHINTYKRIGKYIDPDGEALDVLIVEVKSVNKLERARTALRNFVIKHLSKFEKDYALVAFYSKEDNGNDWRFSFIKLEYRSELDEDKGKVKTKKEFTPAKRYSFLVGKYEKAHTAKNQLLPLLQNISNNPTIEELEAAFSIEKVTDEFFNQYKDLYIKLYEHFENDNKVKAAIKEAGIDNARFTKKLLGQIVFLYFLQKKGWLGVAQNARWGTGKKRFVQELFEQAQTQKLNFFKYKLQYLFYEALAKERDNENSYYKRFDCRIPFLNGGLFEADYNWQEANISIPSTLFRNEEKNKAGDVGTGILDVFDRYNFTIKEDEPLDKEVAVDPEMLGKVFENMLDITERKSKGAFYTPREIVHYMCQESLVHYLDNALNNGTSSYQELGSDQTKLFGGSTNKKGNLKIELEHGKQILVPKKDIELFIREGHFALENDERVATKGETKTYQYQLPESIRKNADLIDQKLSSIKICDPAIGSGAFPVGLLHELVNAMLVLKPHLSYDYLTEKLKGFGFTHRESISDSRYIYRLKRHIIQESIYGVDIDSSAIDIARLRLWLSLVVDEDDLDPIETLPNLDYKIVCGNSLIGIPANGTILDGNAQKHLEEFKEQFYNETDEGEKKKQRSIINKKIQEFLKSTSQWAGYNIDFDFKLFFSEVWREKGGFDVVIGNPPYDVYEGKKSDEIPTIKKIDIYDIAKSGKLNAYKLFLAKSIRILNDGGIFNQIFQNSFLGDNSAKLLRKHFLTEQKIIKIDSFPERDDLNKRVFVSAKMSVCILFSQNKKCNEYDFPLFVWSERWMETSYSSIFSNRELLAFDKESYVIPSVSQAEKDILNKVSKLKRFGSTINCYQGEINLSTNKSIIVQEPKSNTMPLIKGAGVQKWHLPEKMSQGVVEYLIHNDYLSQNKGEKSTHFNFPRIVMQGITGVDEKHRIKSTILEKGFFCGHSINYISLRDVTDLLAKYYLSILNSEFSNWFFKKFSTNSNVNSYEIHNLPLPIYSDRFLPLSIVSSYLLNKKKWINEVIFNFYEHLINSIVYELVFPKEIKSAGKEILKHLGDLKPITDDMSEEKKLAIIQSEFERLYDPNHPVRFAIETLDSVEEVRIIKEALK